MMTILACEDSTPNEPAVEPVSPPSSQQGGPSAGVGNGPSTPAGGGAPPGAGLGPPGLPGLAGTSSAEDLSSSWSDALAVEVERFESDQSCVDEDGDDYVNALSCPGASPSRLDCDDADPNVTPETERWVRPGPFLMGSASDHAGIDEQPVHVVQLTGYCLDRNEVTAEQFADWLRRKGRKAAGADVRNMDERGNLEEGRGLYPAEGVTWAEARAYCRAHGKDLPTEAQWEKAARGGCELGQDPGRCDASDLRAYPWGSDAPTCALANHQSTATGIPKLCTSDTHPVGSLADGAGPYGHLDLAGNVWEFVLDAYHPGVYSTERSRVDPSGPASGEFHVLRGGSWNTFSTNMRAANRFHDLVMGSASGFRCARPDVPSQPDPIPALEMVTLTGSLTRAPAAGEDAGLLEGRALYVTVFDIRDTQDGMLAPGRSPVAETRLDPSGKAQQAFSLRVPAGQTYLLSAALDDGSGASKDDYISASGSGGFGKADDPVDAAGDVDGLHIELQRPPAGGPGAMGPPGGAGMSNGPPGQPPGAGQAPGRPPGKAPGRPPGQPPGRAGQ